MSRELARLGAPVTVRVGSLLQVRAAPGLAARLRRVPGVSGVGPADVAQPDQVISQGLERVGADALRSRGLDGTGIRIAIVDLGFGDSWRALLGKELPPLTQIDAIQSFDHTSGKPDITGLANDDQPTGHGANVAQVVWDFAPGARYTFVNYHTQLELSQAVDWLVNGPGGKPRVDIVVHSNSFLDGPFDGTGVAAQAVNRAHDAGIFWANSAGNYAQSPLGGDRGRRRPRRLGRHRAGRDGATSRSRSRPASAWARRSTGASARRAGRSSRRRARTSSSTSRTPPPRRRSSTPRGRATPPCPPLGGLHTAGHGLLRPAHPAGHAGRALQPRDLRRRHGARRRGHGGLEHPDAR